jgi:hypothetical protein
MLRPSMLRACAVAMAVLGCMLAFQAPARACTIDQKPSVYANGARAQVNPVTPTTQAQMLTWTYFVFTRHYAAHHPVTLTEDRRQLASVLMPSALRTPWTWTLGDGHVAHGWSVRHAYAHPGRYPIGVYAYNPESGQWDLFDRVTVVIGS